MKLPAPARPSLHPFSDALRRVLHQETGDVVRTYAEVLLLMRRAHDEAASGTAPSKIGITMLDAIAASAAVRAATGSDVMTSLIGDRLEGRVAVRPAEIEDPQTSAERARMLEDVVRAFVISGLLSHAVARSPVLATWIAEPDLLPARPQPLPDLFVEMLLSGAYSNGLVASPDPLGVPAVIALADVVLARARDGDPRRSASSGACCVPSHRRGDARGGL
jgi:hypothetical protein